MATEAEMRLHRCCFTGHRPFKLNMPERKIEKALEVWVQEKRYREYDKTREEIADELHTSKEFLHLYFVTRKRVDFRTWRTELRIEDAKKMLLEDKNTSTNIIGELSGFSDRANFYRQFVKIVGCSPKEWRDSNGNPDLK